MVGVLNYGKPLRKLGGPIVFREESGWWTRFHKFHPRPERCGNNNSHVSHLSNHGVAKADLPGASAQQIQAIRLYLLVSKLVNGQSRFGAEDPHWTTKGLEHCQVLG